MEKTKQAKQRKDWIDWSKAILIWLMVLGHAGLSGYPREFVYAFHMPAFFIISGYLYKPHSWLKTLRSFGIPVICFSFINLCYVVLRQWLKGDVMTPSELLISVTPIGNVTSANIYPCFVAFGS